MAMTLDKLLPWQQREAACEFSNPNIPRCKISLFCYFLEVETVVREFPKCIQSGCHNFMGVKQLTCNLGSKLEIFNIHNSNVSHSLDLTFICGSLQGNMVDETDRGKSA